LPCCQTGELPDSEMVPEHNDERWLLDDRAAEQAAAARPGGAASGQKKSASRQQGGRAQAPPAGASIKERQEWAAAFVAALVSGNAAAVPGVKGSSGYKLPLQLESGLVLVSLGRVEFVHPGFHSDKFIYPVGFAVRRRAKTPNSGGKEIWHTAEILEDPQGDGPVFRWADSYSTTRSL